MANRATVTYNGATISTEDKDGSFSVTYNGSTLATLGAGQSKTLNCSGQPMKSDIVVGGKTLRCKNLKMHSDVVVSVVSLFPSAPSAYNLIGTYTANQTWTAPEDGYFQIEVFGASGKGGASVGAPSGGNRFYYATGGGGGGGGYAASRITLNKGDTIALTVGNVGATTSAIVNSSHNNSYDHTLQVTSGANGTDGNRGNYGISWVTGTGGAGGTASGGNYSNANGAAGTDGTKVPGGFMPDGGDFAAGGAGANGAPSGGASAKVDVSPSDNSKIQIGTAGKGSAGFFKIYRGNTN